MNNKKERYMNPEDWKEVKVKRIPHLNNLCVPIGYNRKDGVAGNTLLPACIFEDVLEEVFKRVRNDFSEAKLNRFHIMMPYWKPPTKVIPCLYDFVNRPSSLATTAATVLQLPNKARNIRPVLEYGYNKNVLLSLLDRLKRNGDSFEGVIGNLGYYMTENLVEGMLDWTHNKRYSKEYHLKTTKSFLGFYMRRDMESKEIYSSFNGAHPAAVAVAKTGEISILPNLNIQKYILRIAGKSFDVNDINPLSTEKKDVAVFTPGFWNKEVEKNIENWKNFAPMIPVDNDSKRINLFITNEGNGKYPIERIVKKWIGNAPIPSFGAVLSFGESYYEKLFGKKDLVNESVQIKPEGKTEFDKYEQIFGGFVPAVINGRHLYDVEEVQNLVNNLHMYGNACSPIAQAGRETNNFDPYIREPAGILFQTKDSIGWLMFDGRHELSIGVSVADVGKIVRKMEQVNVFGGKIINAIFIDGGSAMKAYAVKRNDNELNLDLLNRAAAGARNGPGHDPDGLNFYSLLKINM